MDNTTVPLKRIREYVRIVKENDGYDNGLEEKMTFTRAHYREAGVPMTPMYGMPEVSALLLVNKWNREGEVPNDEYYYYI